jgi:hypothetical protein
MHRNSVTSDIPKKNARAIEHWVAFGEDPNIPATSGPHVTFWEGPGGAVEFAAVQFIDKEPWLARGQAVAGERTGVLEIRLLTVQPWKHAAEVTGRVLRAIKPGALISELTALLRFIGDEPVADWRGGPLRLFPPEEQNWRRKMVAASSPRSRGRPGRPDVFFRDIAVEYLELSQAGHRAPNKTLAARHGVQPKAVRDWIARARALGYLGPGRQGKSGAAPGHRLITELKQARASGPESRASEGR